MTGQDRSIRAVLFDLDGTLVDSIDDLQMATNAVLKTLRRRALNRHEAIAFSGDGAATLIARAVAATGAPATEAAMPDLLARFQRVHHAAAATGRSQPYPGAREILATLKGAGLRLAVCTNKPFLPASELLARLGLDRYFDEIVAADTVGARKPDPAPLREILRRLDLPAHTAVMVGDTAADIGAARAAGMASIAVSWGYARGPVARLGAKLVIDNFTELPLALEKLAAPPPDPLFALKIKGAALLDEAAGRADAARRHFRPPWRRR